MKKFEYRVLGASYLNELEPMINMAAKDGFEVDQYSVVMAADSGYLASVVMKRAIVTQDTAGRSSA
jgi:hypothetical protein